MQTTATGAWAGASFHAPFGDRWHSEGSLATDRRYTGQRSLEGSLGSLYHYQARWYSPVLGRFLSPDPFVSNPGNPQNFNRYSYVYNNPLRYTDPSGYGFTPETVWDIGALLIDLALLLDDPSQLNAVLFALDALATALPGVPAVAGTAARRTINVVSEAADTARAAARTARTAQEARGIIGEGIGRAYMRATLHRNPTKQLAYFKTKHVNAPGIDDLLYKGRTLVLGEYKTTSSAGRLSMGLLGKPNIGIQLSDEWILANAEKLVKAGQNIGDLALEQAGHDIGGASRAGTLLVELVVVRLHGAPDVGLTQGLQTFLRSQYDAYGTRIQVTQLGKVGGELTKIGQWGNWR